MTEHIFNSPHPPVDIPDLSITEYVFRGLKTAGDRAVFTEVATGREISGDQAMTKIKTLAGGLVAQGLKKSDVAAIIAPNSIDYFLALHAVAYAGGTVTMVNPSYTAGEVTYQLSQTTARFVLVAEPFVPLAREASAEIQGVEIFTLQPCEGTTCMWALQGEPLTAQVPVDLALDLAAIPFSSGTTGLPKGVMLTHRNLVANASIWRNIRDIGPEDVTPTFLPFMHIFGLTLMQIVYPGAGGHVHLMPRFDLEQFLQLTQDTGAQRLFVVPPIAIALAKSPAVDSYDLSAVREIGSGAAPLSVELGAALAKRINCLFYQGYGMTEVAGVGSAHTPKSAGGDTLGAPLPGMECRVVDPDTGENRGIGEQGELWVRGAMVMKGYLGNPEATAEVLTPEGWLRTGDIVSINADGFLTIHDRLKEMIKYKGFQVAPAEIEAALITHTQITDAAVVGMPDEQAGEAPVGFVVFAQGATLSLEEVQDYLRARLAKYKIITRMQVLNTIPKAASGKILRRELRKDYA